MATLKALKRKLLRNAKVRAEYNKFTVAVEEGRKAAREGRVVPHREVRRWLQSWGTDRRRKPPAAR